MKRSPRHRAPRQSWQPGGCRRSLSGWPLTRRLITFSFGFVEERLPPHFSPATTHPEPFFVPNVTKAIKHRTRSALAAAACEQALVLHEKSKLPTARSAAASAFSTKPASLPLGHWGWTSAKRESVRVVRRTVPHTRRQFNEIATGSSAKAFVPVTVARIFRQCLGPWLLASYVGIAAREGLRSQW